MERLDKFLSRELNITRTQAKAVIRSGGVTVNSFPAKTADMKIDPLKDLVSANGTCLLYTSPSPRDCS